MGVDYLQTFLVRTGRAIGNRKAHTTIPDCIECFITKRSGLEGHVGKIDETEQRGFFDVVPMY